MTSTIRTSCAYCGVGCGIRIEDGKQLTGDPAHPANQGALCVKGSSLLLGGQYGAENASIGGCLNGGDCTGVASRAARVDPDHPETFDPQKLPSDLKGNRIQNFSYNFV